MFEFATTFIDEKIGFSITPLHMQERGFVFFAHELQNQLGYDDLSNTIYTSDSFLENVEYLVLRNGHLREFKKILQTISTSSSSLASIYQVVKFAPSLKTLSPGIMPGSSGSPTGKSITGKRVAIP